MNLQTLKKIHIAVILIVAQILGTLITLLAKATAPDRYRPEDVFQDFSTGVGAASGGRCNRDFNWVLDIFYFLNYGCIYLQIVLPVHTGL